MACSKAQLSTALILSLNIRFFSMVSSTYCPPNSAPAVPSKGHKNTPKSSPAAPANPAPKSMETCPRDTLKLAACANLLNDLVSVVIGTPPKTPCCPLIEGLVDLEAAVCLCTALKANVLGLLEANLNISLTLLLNYCGKGVPSGFQCA